MPETVSNRGLVVGESTGFVATPKSRYVIMGLGVAGSSFKNMEKRRCIKCKKVKIFSKDFENRLVCRDCVILKSKLIPAITKAFNQVIKEEKL